MLTHTTTFGYDFRGNLTGLTDARSQSTTMAWNVRGQLSSLTYPLGHSTGFGYDIGDLASLTDALSRTEASTLRPWERESSVAGTRREV